MPGTSLNHLLDQRQTFRKVIWGGFLNVGQCLLCTNSVCDCSTLLKRANGQSLALPHFPDPGSVRWHYWMMGPQRKQWFMLMLHIRATSTAATTMCWRRFVST